MKPEKSL